MDTSRRPVTRHPHPGFCRAGLEGHSRCQRGVRGAPVESHLGRRDASGHGEAYETIASFTVTTDERGRARFAQRLAREGLGVLSVLVTPAGGSTSEFSKCRTPAVEPADLSLALTQPDAPALAGQPFAITAAVTNAGSATATATEYLQRIPQGMEIRRAETPAGDCAVTGRLLACDLGSLPAGAAATVTMEAVAALEGSYPIAASV